MDGGASLRKRKKATLVPKKRYRAPGHLVDSLRGGGAREATRELAELDRAFPVE